ncbi:MAG: hypothetical protein A2Y62_21905 [Candidatus Fischerbacteria bacterium RBG_13_37_8]|uniref:Methyltransferase type 12 domain-containing protein n=1 Tax=Candidatus Fischerbacteria bacterium RBG_13_37_8 TaxID=1817863 RepID=A0A1F5VUV7_9BACT|nr:MAG: hypothetical protein A2Y62_21905 [Candidatus Fischerbacteria bacterium RBG_13_37_8]
MDYIWDPLKLTLDEMAHVHKYNSFIFSNIKPYLGKVILEIGAGIGNISNLLRTANPDHLIVTDYTDYYAGILQELFKTDPKTKAYKLDISRESALNDFKTIDTIVCINVLEHIKDDVAALRNCHALLSHAGNCILFVPAVPRLYGTLDKNLGHYRRYCLKEVVEKLKKAGFQIVLAKYFNMIGLLGWFASSRIFKKKIIPVSHLKFFENISFILKIEKYIKIPIGLSVIAVGRKP